MAQHQRKKSRILHSHFFGQRTLAIARELLGCVLYRKIGRKIVCGTIIETEAYCGPNDLASHASRGKTARNAVMFGPPGVIYVYLVYGMYWCLNIVTERESYPAAVLIRAVAVPDIPVQRTNGPGKLCRFFHIDKTLNGEMLGKRTGLWIERPRTKKNDFRIIKTPRIGVDYAKTYRAKLWRYVAQSSSRPTRDGRCSRTALRSPRASDNA